MSADEAKLLKLGDYVKRCIPQKSDEYFMVTGVGTIFKLRKVGTKELIKTNDMADFFKIKTTRD